MSGIPRVSVAPDRVTVRPGEGTEVEVTIQNTGRSVEHYGTTVVGLPRDDLYGVVPPTVKLRPGESGTVLVNLNIPDRPAPDAGVYTLGVLVRSPYQKQVSRCEELRVDVQPAPGVSIEAAPEHATGGGAAAYNLRLANDGNTPLDVTLHGTDPEGIVNFSFRPRSVRVAPNASAPAQVTVRAPAPWSGPEARRTLTVRANATGDLSSEKHLTFVQRPRIPGGPLRFVGIALAVGVLATATLAGALVRNASNNSKAGPNQSQAAVTNPDGGGPSSKLNTGGPSAQQTAPVSTAPSSANPPPPAGAPGTTGVIDPSQPPGGGQPVNKPDVGALWAAQGVTLSLNLEHAPDACANSPAAPALRTDKKFGYGAFLTSSLIASVERCNTLAIRFAFAKPVRSVHLTYATKGGQFQMLVTDAHGNITPAPAATPVPDPSPSAGGLSRLVFNLEAPADNLINGIQFGHTSADPNFSEFTVVQRVTFTFA
jgi:hypothetical protein